MGAKKAGKRVRVLFYLLTFYILLQFIWWAYLLIQLNLELHSQTNPALAELKIWMVVGEGAVFLIILLAGILLTQRTIGKEIGLVRQQRNFLLSITHELKTPLAAIQLCLETLSKHDNLDLSRRQILQKNATENTDRLRILIDNVLLATRIDSGEEPIDRSPTDLSEITHKVATRMAHTLDAQNRIQLNIRPQVKGLVDQLSFESILVNLIENAYKYGDDKPFLISLEEEDSFALLKIADSGIGIAPEVKSHIFDKFYRIENEETRTKKGIGLGLYIVKELVELNRGVIRVEENIPSGSVFTVRLPLA